MQLGINFICDIERYAKFELHLVPIVDTLHGINAVGKTDSSIYTAGVRVWLVKSGNGHPEYYLHPRVKIAFNYR